MSSQTETTLDLMRQWAGQNRLRVPEDTSLSFDDAGFDSLHLTELAFFLEDKLGIEIDQTVLWNSATFDGLLQYLAGKSTPDGAAKVSDDRAGAETAEW
jgi:acyl carrier protein